jgi:hypothetical protein
MILRIRTALPSRAEPILTARITALSASRHRVGEICHVHEASQPIAMATIYGLMLRFIAGNPDGLGALSKITIGSKRPFDSEGRIVPPDAARRSVELSDLVEDLRLLGQAKIAVRKTALLLLASLYRRDRVAGEVSSRLAFVPS